METALILCMCVNIYCICTYIYSYNIFCNCKCYSNRFCLSEGRKWEHILLLPILLAHLWLPGRVPILTAGSAKYQLPVLKIYSLRYAYIHTFLTHAGLEKAICIWSHSPFQHWKSNKIHWTHSVLRIMHIIYLCLPFNKERE